MEDQRSLIHLHYGDRPQMAGEVYATIGLLRNFETNLTLKERNVLAEFTEVMGYCLEELPPETLGYIQAVFKNVMIENVYSRIKQKNTQATMFLNGV